MIRKPLVTLGLTSIGVLVAFAAAPLVRKMIASSTGVGVHPEMTPTSARLHNGWTLNPVGIQREFEDMPTLSQVTPDGKYLIVGSTGTMAHMMRCYPIVSPGVLGEPTDTAKLIQAWRGMAIRPEGTGYSVFVSGSSKGTINRFVLDAAGKFSEPEPIELPKTNTKAFTGAVTFDRNGHLISVDENADKSKTKADLLYVFDSASKAVTKTIKLTSEAGALVASPDSDDVYVADYERAQVSVVDLNSGETTATIKVGSQPTALVIGAKGTLFCVNSGADSVSVIDRAKRSVTETISTSLSAKAPLGSVPNSICVSRDETKLFVTNAGNNNVCVVERRTEDGKTQSRVQGFIPTGWYPVSVTLSPEEKSLWIGVGKGFGSKPNAGGTKTKTVDTPGVLPTEPSGPEPKTAIKYDYIMSILRGGITTVPMPDAETLRDYTQTSLASTPYKDSLLVHADSRPKDSVLPDSPAAKSPFEHVVYIIKENRTYDQVFGDMPRGNGDKSLVMFGRDISPNHHKLADEFVLLDNTYCDGEVSQDGWEWSCAANDSDWDIKATTNSYSGKGNPPGGRETIRPSNDYLWEAAAKKGMTYFSYGAKTFRGLFSPTWKGNFSQPWNQGRTDDVPDYKKADIFIDDLKKAEAAGKWSQLTLMSLADDHTSGTRAGTLTPAACVASNDLAIGKIVEAVSKSKFWAKTAIFIIEDDAQNGPDHVDAHRTVALVISPYTKRGTVDSTMYTSSSLLRSIELCLGLNPLSQYDAGAAPMFRCFTGKLNLQPYQSVVPKVDLTARNTRATKNAALSASLDWSEIDRADFDTLNRILWADRKPGVPYPGSVSRFHQ